MNKSSVVFKKLEGGFNLNLINSLGKVLVSVEVNQWEKSISNKEKKLLLKSIEKHLQGVSYDIPNEVVQLMFDRKISIAKAWRLYLNISEEFICRLLDISVDVLEQIELFQGLPEDFVAKFAGALNIHPKQLLRG